MMIALLIARFMYARVRAAGNWPAWLRAISSQAYSFQRIVDVGSAQGLAVGEESSAAGRGADCAQPPASTIADNAYGRNARKRLAAVRIRAVIAQRINIGPSSSHVSMMIGEIRRPVSPPWGLDRSVEDGGASVPS